MERNKKPYLITLKINVDELLSNHDISFDEINNRITILDDSKKECVCEISNIDINNINKYNCFWCRNTIPIDTKVISCPLSYIPEQIFTEQYSFGSKNILMIKENIIGSKEYYKSEGIFCSLNCCKAFIEDNEHIPKYFLSNYYLDLINTKLGNKFNIIKAQHWKILIEYGGTLTIDEFRKNFNKQTTINHGEINFHPEGSLFEKKSSWLNN